MPEAKRAAKLVATTGVVCAMGGYICGDKVDEADRAAANGRPYEIADELLEEARETQSKWLGIQRDLQSSLSSYQITVDSLRRVLYQIAKEDENCLDSNGVLEREIAEWENLYSAAWRENSRLDSLYKADEREIRIRDDQIDSLEALANKYRKDSVRLEKDLEKLEEIYASRAPMEAEFQAIHNCANAHGEPMTTYQFNKQVACCIKSLKEIQKKYPKDKLEHFRVTCEGVW